MQNLERVVLTCLGFVITEMALRDKENYENIEDMYIDITKKLFETTLTSQYIKIIESYLQENINENKQDIMNNMRNELMKFLQKEDDKILDCEEERKIIYLVLHTNEKICLEYSKFIEKKYEKTIKNFINHYLIY